MINLITKRKWLSFFIIFLLVVPDILHSKELSSHCSSPKNAHKRISQVESYQLQQVASFKIQKNSGRFVKKLKSEGQEALIKKGITKDKKVIYRVFVKKYKDSSKYLAVQKGFKQEADSGKTLIKERDTIARSFAEFKESSQDAQTAGSMKPVASFKIFQNKEDAENFSEEVKSKGYETSIQDEKTKNNDVIYTIFAVYRPEQSKDVLLSGGAEYEPQSEKIAIEEKPLETENHPSEFIGQAKDPLPSAEIKHETAPEKPSIGGQPVAEKRLSAELSSTSKDTSPPSDIKHENAVVNPAIEAEPIGTLKGRPTEDVFGRRGGFIHPFLSVTEYYTDNVFFSNDDKKSDFITVISPGIWLTVPHVYEKLLHIDTSNLSPGGFSLSRFSPEIFKRYQAYLFYNADIELFSKYSSENTVNHKAEGLFQYNLRGGLSIELIDQFIASHDIRGTGILSKLDKYHNNLANVIVTYEASDRLKFRVDYTNFLVDYSASRNDFRDRDDNSVSGYIFFKFLPKTAFFTEYEFLDVKYEKDTAFNSREHHYFGGIQWDITAKSKGSIKAGYGMKDFTDSDIKTSKDFVFEAQIDHKFTSKTSLVLKASRRTNETNISGTDFVLTNAVEVEYLQRITGKITADAKFSYVNDRYKGDFTYNGITKALDDDYYMGAFAFQYKFKEWLQTDLGYIYNQRNSNFSDFDYINNILFLRITGSL